MQNANLNESQGGIKTARRNINNLRCALMIESEGELKSFLMKVKEESEKAGLKLNIQKTKIMASGPITSWQMGKKRKQWQILFSWAKITVDIVTSVTKLRCLLLGRKATINLDSVLKGRDITLLTKVHIVKAMIFPVVIYRCENWTIKKAEHRELMLLNCVVGEDS